MGQKANPISLRLQQTNRHFDSCWYSNYFYTQLISKDINIQHYFNSILKSVKRPEGRYFIQNLPRKTKIHFFFCNPISSRETRFKTFQLSTYKKKIKSNSLKKKYSLVVNSNVSNIPILENYNVKKLIIEKSLQNNNIILNKIFSEKNLLLNFSQTIPFRTHNKIFYYLLQEKSLLSSTNSYDLKKEINFGNLLEKKKYLKNIFFKEFSSILETSHQKIDTNIIQYYLRYFVLISFLFKKFYKNIQYEKLIHNFLRYQLFNKKKKIFLAKEHLNLSLNRSTDALIPGLINNIEERIKNSLENQKISGIMYPPKDPIFSFKNFVNTGEENLKKQLPFFLLKNLKYQNYFESLLNNQNFTNIELFPHKISQDWQSAVYLANEIVYYLERRTPFRKIKNKILRDISNNTKIKGIRISCSGRVGGKSKKAQRAKTECIKYGQTSLHIFSGKIDFALKSASTPFGLLGIKVWICYR